MKPGDKMDETGFGVAFDSGPEFWFHAAIYIIGWINVITMAVTTVAGLAGF